MNAKKIYSVINQKGGVGKTTTTINLGTAMAACGAKVLLIDLDPQGNLSTGLGIEKADRNNGTYDILINKSRSKNNELSDIGSRQHNLPALINIKLHYDYTFQRKENIYFMAI